MSIVKSTVVTRTEYEIDWAALAEAVETLVMAKLKKDLEDWAEDRGMRAMYLSDAADGVDVAACLAEGNWLKTDKRLWEMDTAAGEHVYDFIEQTAGKEFFKAVNK